MKGARIFVESLLKENVDTVFYYTGGSVVEIFDELHKSRKDIKYIQCRHEQAGTHMADGYARATGKLPVVLATSGPGATNTITGIATAYMDSIPMVVVTGQVPTSKVGTDAFQEADMVGLTMPITKANFLDADLSGANLRGANLQGAILIQAKLSGATWTDGRVCAEGSVGKCL